MSLPELRRAAKVLRSADALLIGAGAGMGVWRFCERAAQLNGGTLIRINVREPQVSSGAISLPLRALEALNGIAEELERAPGG